jgi:outer membrane protein insertion porin family
MTPPAFHRHPPGRTGTCVAWAFVLWLCAGVAVAQPATPANTPRIAGVEFHVPPGTETAGISDLIALRRGQDYSPRAVRRSIERLYATKKFADVVVRVQEVKGGLNVIFDLRPKQPIAGVTVNGNSVLPTAAILLAARLENDEEYYPERLEEAVRATLALYERKGFYQAQVTADVQEVEEGLEVTLQISEGSATRVASVTVAGAPGLPLPVLLRTLKLELGEVLDQDALREGLDRVKALFREQGYYQAHVFEPEIRRDGLKASVALPISAGPRFHVVFHGNRSFPDAVLLRVIDYDGSEALSRALTARLARRLEGFYRYRGYYDVQVRPREVESPDTRSGVLSFDIEEGGILRVRGVLFEGNLAITDKELQKLLEDRVSLEEPAAARDLRRTDDPTDLEGRTRSVERAPPPEASPGTIYVEEAYAEAAKAMTDLYREQGFLQATVTLTTVEIDVEDRSAQVRFDIQEGPRTLIRRVEFLGIPASISAAEETKVLPGMFLGMRRVEQGRQALQRAVRTQGYLFATSEAIPELSQDQKTATLTYQMKPGPQVRVSRIIVQGLARTEENVVRANLEVKEGEVLDPDALYESQRNLVLIGIFRHVAVRIISPEAVESTKDIVVELKERGRLSGDVFLGYSPVDGPNVISNVSFPNLVGRGILLNARGKLNYFGASAQVLNGTVDPAEVQGINGIGGALNISSHWPRIYSLLPAHIGARLDLIVERVRRSSFQFTRYAAIAGVDWNIAFLTLGLQYEIERDIVSGVRGVELLSASSGVDVERLRFPEGFFSLQTVRFGPTLDFRDDPINTHKGLLIAGTSELTQDFGATLLEDGLEKPTRIYTLKLFGSITGYIPLGPRVVIALSTRGGTILPIVPESRTIPPKRFFLGGAGTMRGFREDAVLPADRRIELRQEVRECSALANRAGCTPAASELVSGKEVPSEGGEAFVLGKAELRLPIFGSVDLGIFAETGNLWLDRHRMNLTDLRTVAGVGLRLGTPIGPLVFDAGFNLFPDRDLNEQTVNFHFTIGLF